MADSISSNISSLPIGGSSVNNHESTGVPIPKVIADALRPGVEQGAENQAFINGEAALHALHNPLLENRIVAEGEAGNNASSLINEVHLKGLTTAASGETNASEKMGAFMATVSMPWKSSEDELRPQYDSAMNSRNPFVEAVRGNPVAKIAALAFIPTTPFALWTLMGGQTSADKALSVVSLAQNEFVIKGIQDGSIRDFSTRVNSGMDFLNGIEIPSINAESDPSLKFAALLLEKVMKSEENPNILQEKVTEHHILGARELLNELNAFLTKKPEDILSGVKENGGPFALKAMVQAVTGVPALLEAKYHAGPQVDSLIRTIGIDEKQAKEHLETLNGVGGFFKNILGLQVKKAETVLEKARESSEIISKQAAQQIMTGLAETVNDPETRQGIHDANSNLTNLGTQLLQAVSSKANQGLTGNLASVNEAIARASKASLN